MGFIIDTRTRCHWSAPPVYLYVVRGYSSQSLFVAFFMWFEETRNYVVCIGKLESVPNFLYFWPVILAKEEENKIRGTVCGIPIGLAPIFRGGQPRYLVLYIYIVSNAPNFRVQSLTTLSPYCFWFIFGN